VVGWDLNGHDCINVDGYDGVHGGYFMSYSASGKKYVYRVAKQTAKTKQDVAGVD